MNTLDKLRFDAKTYKGLIKSYTDDPYINQTIDNLITCLDDKDYSMAVIFLDRLARWYALNYKKIENNEFVDNFDSHFMAMTQIAEYNRILQDHPFESQVNQETPKSTVTEKNPKSYNIFISHSSKDEKICTAFVHLLEMLGVPEENILYSSSERFGIPADMDIFDYLRSSISEEFNVYYMLSDNYYKSVYCLNEMGAAWVNQNEYSIYILPNLTVSIEGVIDSSKKGFRLDNMINLNQLRDKISKDFNSQISTNRWDEEKAKFLKIVNDLN